MKGICFLLVCFMAFSVGLYGQEALTIDDIIGMVKAKLRSRNHRSESKLELNGIRA